MTFLPKVSFIYDQTASYNTDLVKRTLNEYIKKQRGHFSVYFVDLKSPVSFGIHEQTVLTGASVNKVHIVAALYYLANLGKVDLEQKITLQKKDIQNYGTGSLRYQKPGKSYSLKTLAKLTLQQSDNTATYLLANKIGRKNVQNIMNQLGLTQTDILDNKTSLTDVALLYQKLYNNKVTSSALTKELLGFMKDTDIEDRLPANLPADAVVYHKTGDGIGFVHDVGIITNGKQTYFLGVLSADVGGDEANATQAIAHISKTVYDYVTQQD